MKAYDYVLCLFCLSGCEQEVAEKINRLDCGRALFPQRIKTFRMKNEWRNIKVALIPGYVFVYLNGDEAEHLYPFETLSQVIRVLKYEDGDTKWLNGADMRFADWVWNQDGLIDLVDAIQIGDYIEIVDTELKKLRGRVAKMDRRRKTVKIEMDGAGIINNVWLPYQVIQKIDEKPSA